MSIYDLLANQTISKRTGYFYVVTTVILKACHHEFSTFVGLISHTPETTFYGRVLMTKERSCSVVLCYSTKRKITLPY